MAIIIGGSFSTIFSRKLIFSVQSVIMIALAISFVYLLKTPDQVKLDVESNTSKLGFIGHLKIGFAVFKNRKDTLMISGLILMNIAVYAWVQLILFPFYFGYSGSDFGAGIIRSLSFILEGIVVLIAGIFTKTRSNRSWLSLFVLLEGLVFFFSFAIFLHFIPFTYKLELYIVALILILFVFADFVGLGAHLIQKKLFVDLIPNEMRNSFYSLETTLVVMFASPLMILIGYIIDNYGFPPAIAFLGIFPIIGAFLIYLGRQGDVITSISSDGFTTQ